VSNDRVVDAFSAWAAGFIDGEGCIRITRSNGKSGRSVFIEVSVTQSSRELLDLFKDRWGGYIIHYKKGFKSSYTKREMFQYKIVARGATKLLEDVYPFLIGKKQQAKYTRAFSAILGMKRGKKNTPGWIEWSDHAFEKVRDLKRRPELRTMAA
jgi:hypothetical protein